MMGITKGMSLGAHFQTNRPISPIPWILCATGSGISLLVAIGTSIYTLYFLTGSTPATATITEIIERKNDEGNTSYSSVYSYALPDGQKFTDRSSMSDGREYQVGDTIPIRYLVSSPHQSRIDYFAHHWSLPIFMIVVSLGLAAVALGLRWWREKEQQWANHGLTQIRW
ncbi:MAG: DUF3592 domain-containing protein [Opitutaceae bacterium]|jgi:hypothetical protein|nr:DUF3592 domain-containing protein [Opitutaceae bacterium]